MTTFTLHLPRDARPGDATALDESELVKDAFSWGAFFFTFFWFFFHRLWLAGLGVLLVVFAFGGIMALLDVHPLAGSIAQLLLQALDARAPRPPGGRCGHGIRPGRGGGQGLRPLARHQGRASSAQPGSRSRSVHS
jgi:hypothetical protein